MVDNIIKSVAEKLSSLSYIEGTVNWSSSCYN